MPLNKTVDFFFDSKNFTFKQNDLVWNVALPFAINNCHQVEIASFSAPFFTSETNGYNQLFDLPAENEEIHFMYLDQNDSPITLNLSIPGGQYTIAQILSLLNSQMATILGSIATITLGISGSNYITFSVSSSQTFGGLFLINYTFLSDLLMLSPQKIYLTFGSTSSTSVTSLVNRNYLKWYNVSTLHYSINDVTTFFFTPSSNTLTYVDWFTELVAHMKASATSMALDWSGLAWSWTGTQFRLSCSTASGSFLRWSPTASADDYTSNSILYYINYAQNYKRTWTGQNYSAAPICPFSYQISAISTTLVTVSYRSTSSTMLSIPSWPWNFVRSWSFTAGNTLATFVPTVDTTLGAHGYDFILDSIATSTNGEPATTITMNSGSTNMAYMNILSSVNFSNFFGTWSGTILSYGNTSYNRTSDSAIAFEVTNYNTTIYVCSSLCDNIYMSNEYSKIMFNILYGDSNGTMIIPFMPENIKFTPNSGNIQSFTIFLKDKNLSDVNLFGQPIHIHFRFHYYEY